MNKDGRAHGKSDHWMWCRKSPKEEGLEKTMSARIKNKL